MDRLNIVDRYKNITQRLRILVLQNIHEEDYDTGFLLEINRLSAELLNLKRAERIERSRSNVTTTTQLKQCNNVRAVEPMGV